MHKKRAKTEIDFNFIIENSLKNIVFTSIEGMNIYRTIQEAINNSIKYANAKNINIETKQENDTVKITINDDGKGFDEQAVEKGYGLMNMKKRIEEIVDYILSILS